MAPAPRAQILALTLAGAAGLATALAPRLAHAAWETRAVAGVEAEIYAPAALSPVGDGRGLLVVLHGCTQTAADLRALAELSAGADAFGVVIAVPQVPGGGVYAGCWDYYGVAHTRETRHDDDLLTLVAELGGDPALAIDPDQVYVAGLSSGGGEALVLGCLAPDVFAGIGLAAAPGLGTEVFEFSSVSTTAAEEAALCETFAGAASPRFADQLLVVYNGASDFTVAQGYAPLHVEAMTTRYGALAEGPLDVAALAGHAPAGQGWIYSDAEGPRIARIVGEGGGHAWPAGTGPGLAKSFVEPAGVDLGAFMAEFFTLHNRRVAAIDLPDDTDTDTDTDGSGDDSSSSDGSGTGGDGTASGTGDGTGDGTDADTGGSSEGCTEGGSTDDGVDSSGASAGSGATSGTSAGFGDARGDGDEGCGCQAGPRSPAGLAGLLMIALARGRRRRRGH